MPSVVDFDTGRVLSSVNVPLADVPLREVLSERLGVPVFVDNDATVAALAEAHDEHLSMVARDLVMITVGTGVGGGIVLGGRIYRGATGGAGELGHTLIGLDLSGATPSAGAVPPAGVARARGRRARAGRLAEDVRDDHPDSALGQAARAGASRPASTPSTPRATVTTMAASGGAPWGERLGIGIANAINTFDPEEVVIGGGAARAGELLLEPARRIAAGYVVPGLGQAHHDPPGPPRRAGRRPRCRAAGGARARRHAGAQARTGRHSDTSEVG